MEHITLLCLMVLVTAILYSSVGHAGASGYLAVMALMSVPPDVMKPTALTLNIVVGTIATIRFAAAGSFAWRIFWPFAIASIPMSFVGGAIRLDTHVYKIAVGIVLLVAAARLANFAVRKRETIKRSLPIPIALLIGAAIGLLAGLTGTGGGIFLSPILLLTGWADTRETAGVSAAFVLTNSLAGLAGNFASVQHLPYEIGYLAVTAAVGGIIGAELGSRRITPPSMRILLAAVLVIAGFKLIFAS